MLSMLTDLMFILSILVLLFFTSLGSYWFLSYCFPDANYANIDTDQLNRRRALLALTTGMLVPEAALVKAAEQCGQLHEKQPIRENSAESDLSHSTLRKVDPATNAAAPIVSPRCNGAALGGGVQQTVLHEYDRQPGHQQIVETANGSNGRVVNGRSGVSNDCNGLRVSHHRIVLNPGSTPPKDGVQDTDIKERVSVVPEEDSSHIKSSCRHFSAVMSKMKPFDSVSVRTAAVNLREECYILNGNGKVEGVDHDADSSEPPSLIETSL